MIIDGWYCCPHCGKRFFKVDDNAHCNGVEIKCSGKNADGTKCRKVIKVNFEDLSLEPQQ